MSPQSILRAACTRFGAATLVLASLACSGQPDEPADSGETIRSMAAQRYRNIEVLAANGNDTITIDVVGTTPLDLKEPEALKEEIAQALAEQPHVIPHTVGRSDVAPFEWLHAHLVPREQVIAVRDDDRTEKSVFAALDQAAWAEGWRLEMRLEVDGQTVEYAAFVFVPPQSPTTIEIIDPVVLGADDVDTAPRFRHGTVGKSASGTWIGCEPTKEKKMAQGVAQHDDNGSCLGFSSYSCYDKGWCNDEAKAVITCNTTKPGCPRMVSSTTSSGDCHSESGPTKECIPLQCVSGSDHNSVSLESKSDTIPGKGKKVNGIDEECSLHTSMEALQASLWSSAAAWEITYSTPDTPVGSASLKYTDSSPSHSVYQVYQQIMCCQAPPSDPGVAETTDSEGMTGDSDGDDESGETGGAEASGGEETGGETTGGEVTGGETTGGEDTGGTTAGTGGASGPCGEQCDTYFGCDETATIDELDDCIATCEASLEEAEATSPLCSDATVAAVECVAGLTCDEFWMWWDQSPTGEYPCYDAELFKLEACG